MAFSLDPEDDFVIDYGEYVEIYDTTPDPDLRLIYGTPDLMKTQAAEGIYYLIDGAEKDFSKKVTITAAASKSHAKLQNLIDTYCDFITGTIADDSFADWTYGCKDSEIRKVIADIMNHEIHMFKITTVDAATFIADPMSGAAVATLNNGNMDNVDPEDLSYPITQVKLTGAWVVSTGDYLRSEWNTTEIDLPSQNILSDAYPLITVQGDLDNLASQIGDMRKNQVLKLKCEIVDQTALLLYGQIVEVCYPLLGIGTEDASYVPVTYEKFMITRSAQNDNGMLYLEMISAFVFTRGMESDPAVIANERIETLAVATKAYVDAHLTKHTYCFAATTNTATAMVNANWTTVPFEDEEYDPASLYNVNGTFTAPVAGVWHFDARCLLTAYAGWGVNESWEIQIFKNGAETRYGTRHNVEFAGTLYADMMVSCDLKLAANDAITVRIYNGSGANINLQAAAQHNHFEGHWVSDG